MHARPLKHDSREVEKVILRKAILRLVDHLSISRAELCGITGLSAASLSRLYDNKRFIDPSSKEGELCLLLLRLYRSLDTLFGGNQEQCKLWLRSENHHLKGIPIHLMQSIQGLNLVIIYLDAMRGRN